RRSSASERLWRWCRRNPVVAGLVTTVALLLIAGSIGSTAAAVRLRQSLKKGEQAEAKKTEQLWEAELARARARRFSHPVGQRFESCAALKRAAALGVFPERRREMRDETIACLALPDVRRERELGIWDGKEFANSYWIGFDGAFEHYAYADREGAIVLRRVDD